MHGLATVLMALTIAAPGGSAADLSLAEKIQKIVADYDKERATYLAAVRKVKTAEDRRALASRLPDTRRYGERLLEAVAAEPRNAAALDAYFWIVTHATARRPAGDDRQQVEPFAAALTAIHADFLKSDRLGAICLALRTKDDAQSQALLRAVREGNPHKHVQGLAALALAQSVESQASLVRRIRALPANQASYERLLGKERVQELIGTDQEKLDAQSVRLFEEAAEKYSEHIAQEELAKQCQLLQFNRAQGAELFLRHVMENAKSEEVQAAACLSLCNRLKSNIDTVRRLQILDEAKRKQLLTMYSVAVRKELETADPDKLTGDCLELFETVVEKYGQYKDARGRTYADLARAAIFELDKLALGKPAPDIVDEDLDGKTFKLSDYKVKVILLDFWGHW